MELSPEEKEALKSFGRARLDRGTAEFFALRKADDYAFPESGRVPGLSPEILRRLLDAGLVEVGVRGEGGDVVTLTAAGARLADELLADE
jgi:hypothetical protein